jgi:Family of unknown function (DUF6352)
MPDFWRHSGFHLLARDARGRLTVTDDYLRAYFARPEVAPVAESCPNERTLFAALMETPRRVVSPAEIDALADTDARESYRIVLKFRDRLIEAGTVEGCYMALFRAPDGNARDFAASGLPPMFVDQMAQAIARNMLEGCDDGLAARAAELLFREQRAHVDDGRIILADLETVEMNAARTQDGSQYGGIGRLIAEAKTALKAVELDVLHAENAALYWARDERHDTALQVNFGREGLTALCSVLEQWIAHFFAAKVSIKPVRSIDNARLKWYCGLDREATVLFNDLYNGAELDYERARRILCLMELRFDDRAVVRDELGEAPIYLALAMDQNNEVRMKPQNLLINLPIRVNA